MQAAHVGLKAVSRVQNPRTQLAHKAVELGQMLGPNVPNKIELVA